MPAGILPVSSSELPGDSAITEKLRCERCGSSVDYQDAVIIHTSRRDGVEVFVYCNACFDGGVS